MDPEPASFMDPERLVQCPYDKNHQIRACRLPYHLVKCRENNKKIAKELVTCPYNARHRVPKLEFNMHVETCENKVSPEEHWMISNPKKATEAAATTWQCPASEEDWEADAVKSPAPSFVFGNSYQNMSETPTLLKGPSWNYLRRSSQDKHS